MLDTLDNQSFTLIINFVNTNFDGGLLRILKGTGQNLHEPIGEMTSIQLNSSQIIHISISSSHEVTLRYTIEDFAPIGGLYICLIGTGNISDDGMNILRDANFSKWISKENQSIEYMPKIILLSKFYLRLLTEQQI